MRVEDIRFLLQDKRVMEEIHKHLWLESQKVGYNIGLERAIDEWLQLYAEVWMKYHLPEKYELLKRKQVRDRENRKRLKNSKTKG